MTTENTTRSHLSRREIVDKHREYMLPSIGSHYQDPLPFVKGSGATGNSIVAPASISSVILLNSSTGQERYFPGGT